MDQTKRILIVGASGFIGRRLVARLAEMKCRVRALSRSEAGDVPLGVETIRGDLLQEGGLDAAFAGIDTAYYLVHSLDIGRNKFAEQDRCAAGNFVKVANRCGVRRVIYLSGLGETGGEIGLSEHLHSRHEVGEILQGGLFSTTVLRAAIIVGAGGASFEILKFLVKSQPLLPDWPGLDTLCQPIAVENVIGYLADCLLEEQTSGECFDVCGPDVLSYRQMLEEFARVVGDVNLYLPLPVFSAKWAARFIGTFSNQKTQLVQALLEGMNNEVICHDNRLQELIPQRLVAYPLAVQRALQERD